MKFLKNIFAKSRHLILYGALMAVLIFLLKWLQWKFLIVDNSLEIYVGLLAVLFTVLGGWMAAQFIKSRTVVVEKEVPVPAADEFTIDQRALEELQLTEREYEVLQLIARGMSNAEIASSLFLSVSTVKTHAYNLFSKMDVKSRTQAIEKAKRLRIVP